MFTCIMMPFFPNCTLQDCVFNVTCSVKAVIRRTFTPMINKSVFDNPLELHIWQTDAWHSSKYMGNHELCCVGSGCWIIAQKIDCAGIFFFCVILVSGYFLGRQNWFIKPLWLCSSLWNLMLINLKVSSRETFWYLRDFSGIMLTTVLMITVHWAASLLLSSHEMSR
jgi:hypothetical protein